MWLRTQDGTTALKLAAKRRKNSIVAGLLRRDALVDFQDNVSPPMVQMLSIQALVNVSVLSVCFTMQDGWMVLVSAVHDGHLDIAELVVAHIIDVDFQDKVRNLIELSDGFAIDILICFRCLP